jgi:hypothetical protein
MTRGLSYDILDGLSSSVAVKGPCALKTTGNVVLAGEQVIDGTLTDETRVLVGSQTSSAENGIYITSTGDWRRAADFSRNNDIVNGTLVNVTGGPTGVGIWSVVFTGALALDTTAITFESFVTVAGYAPLASPTFTGTPAAPTPVSTSNSTAIATTAFVQGLFTALKNGVSSAYDTLAELATAVTANTAALSTELGYSTQTADYTLALTDAGGFVAMNKASGVNLTVPPNSSVAFPTRSRVDFGQYGAGQVTVVAGAGVTIRSSSGKLKLTGQYSGGTLLKIGTNEWWLFGDLSA